MQNNNRPTRHDRRQERLNIPQRGGNDSDGLTPLRSQPSSVPKPKIGSSPKDRSFFGFDDIPVDDENMDNVRFVDILKAWGKRGIQHSPIERYLKASKAKKKHLKQISNDLKWAMQADLDEPVAPRPKQPRKPTAPKQLPSNPPVPSAPESKTIDININFGSLPKAPKDALKKKARALLRYKKSIAAVVIVAIASFGYFVVWPPLNDYAFSRNGPDIRNSEKSPGYSTVLPKDKPVSELGGWKRVSPEGRDPVFAYADKIGDVSISVSQQPLPESFKSETSGKIAELAKQFSATEKIDANGTDVYIGTSAKGPQSVIFTKNGLLVLMKSQQKAESESWKTYVESLVGTDPSLSNF